MANSRLFLYGFHLLLLLACLPSSCGGFPNHSNSKPTQNQPQQQEQQQVLLPGACSSNDDDDDDGWLSSSARQLFVDETTRQRLVETIQAGRVYQHEDFLTPAQVDMLLEEILNLQDSFERSGLSNTQKGSQQEFGSSDRFVCPVPWWKDSLLLASSSSSASSLHDNTAKNNTVAMLLNKLRFFLSDALERPTMKDDPTSSSSSSPIAHECYYSVAHQGSVLARHMDERHEECKGAKGWLLPSRRSLSWLIYLTDPNWDLEENGGGLRTFPQKRVQQHVSSTHEGNLQVGWLVPPPSSSNEDHDNDVSLPVYLDSWFQPQKRGMEPHCILYTVSPPSRDTSTKAEQSITHRAFLTQAWLSTALPPGISIMDFIKAWAVKDSNDVAPPPSPPNGSSDSALKNSGSDATSTTTTTQGLFLSPEFARQFALLEERQEWDAGQLPRGCQVQDINPTRASLIVFDSVLLPHQVEAVKKGRRIALAGWMHEATQPFPEEYYSTF